MSLTIILSGPKVSTSQARTALASAGFGVEPTEHDYGLPPLASGEEIREAQSFITAAGDDIDRATQAVSALGWRLRMHYPPSDPPPPTAEEQMASRLEAMEAEIAALKARLA